MIRFILVNDWGPAIEAVAERLRSELGTGKRVLWFISGGSQIPANTKIMRSIPDELSGRLTIIPIDERYGPVGHPESNLAKQLSDGFEPMGANLLSVLKAGLSFDETSARFEDLIAEAFASNDMTIGQLGLGADGHTAGILPESVATRSNHSLTTHYDAPPLKRLTATFSALKRLDVAYILAFGNDKLEALDNLKQSLSLDKQPAQIIKDISEAYVYNDQIGD